MHFGGAECRSQSRPRATKPNPDPNPNTVNPSSIPGSTLKNCSNPNPNLTFSKSHHRQPEFDPWIVNQKLTNPNPYQTLIS